MGGPQTQGTLCYLEATIPGLMCIQCAFVLEV